MVLMARKMKPFDCDKMGINITKQQINNEQTNCPNCGAPITHDRCEYCGTKFTHKN